MEQDGVLVAAAANGNSGQLAIAVQSAGQNTVEAGLAHRQNRQERTAGNRERGGQEEGGSDWFVLT